VMGAAGVVFLSGRRQKERRLAQRSVHEPTRCDQSGYQQLGCFKDSKGR
jgi:hypothetical protein